MRAGPRVAFFLARSRTRSTRAAQDDTIVPVRPTAGLAVQALLDEVLIAVFRHPDLLPRPDDYAPAAADLASTSELFCGPRVAGAPGPVPQKP